MTSSLLLLPLVSLGWALHPPDPDSLRLINIQIAKAHSAAAAYGKAEQDFVDAADAEKFSNPGHIGVLNRKAEAAREARNDEYDLVIQLTMTAFGIERDRSGNPSDPRYKGTTLSWMPEYKPDLRNLPPDRNGQPITIPSVAKGFTPSGFSTPDGRTFVLQSAFSDPYFLARTLVHEGRHFELFVNQGRKLKWEYREVEALKTELGSLLDLGIDPATSGAGSQIEADIKYWRNEGKKTSGAENDPAFRLDFSPPDELASIKRRQQDIASKAEDTARLFREHDNEMDRARSKPVAAEPLFLVRGSGPPPRVPERDAVPPSRTGPPAEPLFGVSPGVQAGVRGAGLVALVTKACEDPGSISQSYVQEQFYWLPDGQDYSSVLHGDLSYCIRILLEQLLDYNHGSASGGGVNVEWLLEHAGYAKMAERDKGFVRKAEPNSPAGQDGRSGGDRPLRPGGDDRFWDSKLGIWVKRVRN